MHRRLRPGIGFMGTGIGKRDALPHRRKLELEIEISTPVQSIEYRYFLSVNDKQIFEEWEKNHQVFFIGNANRYNLYDYWQVRPPHLAFYSSAFTKSLFAHPCNTHERVIKSGKRLTIKIAAPRVEKKPARGHLREPTMFGKLESPTSLSFELRHFSRLAY